ncbi:unnamed protein product [Aphanomyces euteiches]|uniref:Hexose transporter 1 n=1 Tax=Aphanomyces euteiches TaxID=100861 RepID=A0A6G0XS36_9STRA|nr:hypothetical protein Ae201684_002030 [Aphanomyces euteiches]KAH9086868.1 hypothetical protein Ae201684P_000285 [Aphanomyces euteiches]KAH9134993.1 hypothetical protein AeRB84_019375 [Aphanomyces euteiches]
MADSVDAAVAVPVVSSSTQSNGSNRYAITVCVFASLGGIYFGYDQGVTGGVLVMSSFLNHFCVGYGGNDYDQCTASSLELPDNWLNFTTTYMVLYYVGCMIGAYFGGVIADKFGRRAAIFAASLVYCVGTFLLLFTNHGNHTMALFARVIQGIGVGISSFSSPIFGAEMAPKELRGMLSGFMLMAIVTGILISGLINYGVQDTEHGWRITISVATIFPVILMGGIFFVPESPRWAYQYKGRKQAEAILVRLRQTDNVDEELTAIGDVLEQEGNGEATWKDVFHPTIRRRLYIAMILQAFQQATGINPIFTYGGQIFKDVIGNGIGSLLILQIINFFSTMPAMYWVDKTGRRTLLLLGAVGMVMGHLVAAIAFSTGCHGNDKDFGCGKGAGWIMILATAFFVFSFAISWGPIPWVYPAEIFPLKVRAKAVTLSTFANWAFGAVMIEVPKLFPYLHVNGVFFLFGFLCCCGGTFVYYMCPETKNLLLEDIELLFTVGNRVPQIVLVGEIPAEIETPAKDDL